MSRLLLTGGTGFIGSQIIEELDRANLNDSMGIDTLRLFVRNIQEAEKIKCENYEIEIFEGDLLNPRSIIQAATDVEYVIHTAALYALEGKKEKFYAINVEGTSVLIDALNSCKGFILTSTYGVYGFNTGEKPITEEHEDKNPFWHYQESKYHQEVLAQKMCKEKSIPFIALRLPNVIGAGDEVGTYGIMKNLEKGLIFLLRKGKGKLPVSHVSDVARVHVKALKNIEKYTSEIFNVASYHVTFKGYVNAYAKEMGLDPVKKKVPYWLFYGLAAILDFLPIKTDITRFGVKFLGANNMLDTSKVEEELGFEPKYSFEETIKETVEWYNSLKKEN